MNDASAWRLALARKIAKAYLVNPKVSALVVAGSVARGHADRYSGIEIDIFYAEPIDDSERLAAAERAGGERLREAWDEPPA